MENDRTTGQPRERSGFELVSPKDVLSRNDLTREEKIELLKQWELDLRAGMQTPAGEPPAPPMQSTLAEILDSLNALDARSNLVGHAGTE